MVRWVEMQKTHECIYCVVDMHAITVWQDPDELKAAIRSVTAAYMAAGLDPKRSILFNQSQVPEHAELAWVFNCVARLGWLNRMTQFKEKAGKDRENASVGLYAYPVLMAADILAYRATHVPVGDDQKQHLELARDIAQKFNNDFADADPRGRASRTALLPAARARHHGAGDARHEPARRHQEDVEVGSLRLVAHQHDGRCRHHRPEDPEGQDRSRAAARRRGRAWRAARKPTISSASTPRSPTRPKPQVLQEFGGAQFSSFKKRSGRAGGGAHRPGQCRDDAAAGRSRPRSIASSPTAPRAPGHRRASHAPGQGDRRLPAIVTKLRRSHGTAMPRLLLLAKATHGSMRHGQETHASSKRATAAS